MNRLERIEWLTVNVKVYDTLIIIHYDRSKVSRRTRIFKAKQMRISEKLFIDKICIYLWGVCLTLLSAKLRHVNKLKKIKSTTT